MQVTATDWMLEVERGPSCLYIRPRRIESANADYSRDSRSVTDTPNIDTPTIDTPTIDASAAHDLAELIWEQMNQHLTFRVVIECDEIASVSEPMMTELIRIKDRAIPHDGFVRICGLSETARLAMAKLELPSGFYGFADRADALMSGHVGRPR